jgi:hypothetical protein
MLPEDLKQTKRFFSPQDQIQWGILFLGRHLRKSSPWDREQCLQDVWEWACRRGASCLRLAVFVVDTNETELTIQFGN